MGVSRRICASRELLRGRARWRGDIFDLVSGSRLRKSSWLWKTIRWNEMSSRGWRVACDLPVDLHAYVYTRKPFDRIKPRAIRIYSSKISFQFLCNYFGWDLRWFFINQMETNILIISRYLYIHGEIKTIQAAISLLWSFIVLDTPIIELQTKTPR